MAAAVENDPKILMIRRLNSSLTESIDVVYMTINNFRNFDDNSLGKLSSVIFVTMMTVDDLFNADGLATLDCNSMV